MSNIIPVPPSAKSRLERWAQAMERLGDLVRQEVLSVQESNGDGDPADSMEERLVQAIWHDQLLDAANLRTASGKVLEVLEPGRWNTGRGPDFLEARLRIAGREVFGDVEIHVTTREWEHHQHQTDFEYNRVVLHVCFSATDDRPYDQKQNGERLERLILEPVLQPDLETILRTVNPDDYPFGSPADTGLCHRTLSTIPQQKLQDFLLTAGKARLEDKIDRFRAQAAHASLDQVFYQALLTGMGYKSNKTCYFLLSKRAPLAELLDFASEVSPGDWADVMLAILMGTANLLPNPKEAKLPLGTEEGVGDGGEDSRYQERLWNYWVRFRPYFSDRLIPPTKRWFAGMRPQGFPARRFAASVLLMERLLESTQGLFGALEQLVDMAPVTGNAREWSGFFKLFDDVLMVTGGGHYFTTHYGFGGKPVSPQALLGQPAARVLIFNTILPLLILKARQEKNATRENRCWEVLLVFPALGENAVTKMMIKRLFADSGLEKSFCKSELKQQALYKIFQDCCAWNERTCENCTFFQAPLNNSPRDKELEAAKQKLRG
ncbi:MAG: DUF2851 family protein [Candidatus Sumerlaeia bacterium]|nr:DUF2851 family protein [Candidatus Sumerlaeia bacterium]